MKTVRVKVDLSRPATLPKGSLDPPNQDSTTEIHHSNHQAQDDPHASLI